MSVNNIFLPKRNEWMIDKVSLATTKFSPGAPWGVGGCQLTQWFRQVEVSLYFPLANQTDRNLTHQSYQLNQVDPKP